MVAVSTLKGTARGEDILIHVQNIVSLLDLKLNKLVNVTTDGARNMTVKNIFIQHSNISNLIILKYVTFKL